MHLHDWNAYRRQLVAASCSPVFAASTASANTTATAPRAADLLFHAVKARQNRPRFPERWAVRVSRTLEPIGNVVRQRAEDTSCKRTQ